MPVSYDFKNASRNTPSRRGTAGRRLRFIILLLVVAAVTAGVIMLIVPKKTKISENGENRAQSVENNGKNGQNPENTTAKDDDNTPSAVKDNDNVLPVTDAGDKNDPVLQIDNTKTDNTEVEISRGKGKVLPGDLPANEDKPVFRASQAPGAAELLDRAAALNDPDEIIALLSGFLMKEYSAGGEYSANWNAAGKELAAVLRKKAAKNDWKAQSIVHKVVSRDNFIKISRRYHTTVEGIKFINNRKTNMIRIGDKLNVVSGPWRITVSKKARLLNVWRKGKDSWQIFAVFPIGVGRKNLTPNGKFVIIHRMRHPKWYGPDGRIFAYGDKENPLGDYFLKLRRVTPAGVKKDQGYGIHGSADDSSVGRSVSNGCLRMKNCDVEILYYLLPAMTPVEITD